MGEQEPKRIECRLDFDGPVIYDDGSVNWAAAFAADDGVGECEKCAHLRGGVARWIAYHPCWHPDAARPEAAAEGAG